MTRVPESLLLWVLSVAFSSFLSGLATTTRAKVLSRVRETNVGFHALSRNVFA